MDTTLFMPFVLTIFLSFFFLAFFTVFISAARTVTVTVWIFFLFLFRDRFFAFELDSSDSMVIALTTRCILFKQLFLNFFHRNASKVLMDFDFVEHLVSNIVSFFIVVN